MGSTDEEKKRTGEKKLIGQIRKVAGLVRKNRADEKKKGG